VKRTARRNSAVDLDPFREREARKYENPIPSREYILECLTEQGLPLGFDDIAGLLRLQGGALREALDRRLNAMVRDGQLVRNRRGLYCLVNRRDLIAGRVIGHPDGFGFLQPDTGGEDLFLSPREMRSLMHDDRAVVRVTGIDARGRREGALVEVLERNTRRVVGRLRCEAGIGFVKPDNQRLHHDIVIPPAELGNARKGDIVVAEITEYPSASSLPLGRILEVLGEHLAPGMETDIAIRTFELPVVWPEAVEQEIAGLGTQVEEAAKSGRTDLRKLALVTIDGVDARDFDDAVYCARTPKGWRLLVCIADVSAYVRPGTALDAEAKLRGNSVYFPDRVIPMLPEVLSNGLCSLNPEVDRLCLTCEMYIKDSGDIVRSRFFPGVMRSRARLTYDEVAVILAGSDPGLEARYAKLLPRLRDLEQIYRLLRATREQRGALDLDTHETRIEFDAQGKIERLVAVERNDAHRLIEECMLAANLCAARLLLRNKMPALFRIHEAPPAEKIEDLKRFLGELGLRLPGTAKPGPKDFALLLDSTRERGDAHLIQTVLLRSLSQALYSPNNNGHFGLAYDAYTHFTSPIRRYPDLVVHRAIKHWLLDGTGDNFTHSLPELQTLGEHCSMTERRADEATRDVTSWLKCEYMQDKLGEEFDGLISGVNSFGLFVELKGLYVDGLVHITALRNDYYHFDPIGHRLTGERSGRVYRLGDPFRVKVAQVNLEERKIDFVPAAGEADASPDSGPKRRRSGWSRGSANSPASTPTRSKRKDGEAKERPASGALRPHLVSPGDEVSEAASPATKPKKRRTRQPSRSKSPSG